MLSPISWWYSHIIHHRVSEAAGGEPAIEASTAGSSTAILGLPQVVADAEWVVISSSSFPSYDSVGRHKSTWRVSDSPVTVLRSFRSNCEWEWTGAVSTWSSLQYENPYFSLMKIHEKMISAKMDDFRDLHSSTGSPHGGLIDSEKNE